MRSPIRLPLALAAALSVSLSGQAPDPRAEVERTLQSLKFTAQELATLQSGKVIARAEASSSGEMLTQAAVKIRAAHQPAVAYYGQMIAYVDGKVTLGFGKFSTPATLGDVDKLAFGRDEVEALKNCKPGNCDIRLGGAGMKAVQSAVDWSAADYVERANAFARKMAVDYVNTYRARGDEALITFDDTGKSVSLKAEWSGILANSQAFHAQQPALARYLGGFPKETLPGARDIMYWIKEDYGRKPVISIVHGVVYAVPGQTDRTLVAQKYIYASHYYDASLAMASVVSGTENGAPVTYIIYGNRSRGDLLKGGFGGLTRSVARSQATKAAEGTLGTIKEVLEKMP